MEYVWLPITTIETVRHNTKTTMMPKTKLATHCISWISFFSRIGMFIAVIMKAQISYLDIILKNSLWGSTPNAVNRLLKNPLKVLAAKIKIGVEPMIELNTMMKQMMNMLFLPRRI